MERENRQLRLQGWIEDGTTQLAPNWGHPVGQIVGGAGAGYGSGVSSMKMNGRLEKCSNFGENDDELAPGSPAQSKLDARGCALEFVTLVGHSPVALFQTIE
jgi:hypothetical protein